MLMQEFYDPNSGTMISDTARVYLRSSVSLYAIIDSAKQFLFSGIVAVNSSDNSGGSVAGSGIFTFLNATSMVGYYLQLKHRNPIETWSKTPQSFNSNNLIYDFTLDSAKAYGDNMIRVNTSPNRYAMFGGDVNQDGSADVADLLDVFNDASAFITGYAATDVTGDYIVDSGDLLLTYRNSAINYWFKIYSILFVQLKIAEIYCSGINFYYIVIQIFSFYNYNVFHSIQWFYVFQ